MHYCVTLNNFRCTDVCEWVHAPGSIYSRFWWNPLTQSRFSPDLPWPGSLAVVELGVQCLLSQRSSLHCYQSGVLWRQNNSRLNPTHDNIHCMQSSVISTGSHLSCIWQFGLSVHLVWMFFNNVACFITEISVSKITLLETGRITTRVSTSRLNKVWHAGPIDSFHYQFTVQG